MGNIKLALLDLKEKESESIVLNKLTPAGAYKARYVAWIDIKKRSNFHYDCV